MALRVPYLVLAVLGMIAGVVTGAHDAWPEQSSGNQHSHTYRTSLIQPDH